MRFGDDLGPTLVAVVLFDIAKLVRDDVEYQLLGTENFAETTDRVECLVVFADDLLALESRELLQAHAEDRLRLEVAELEAGDKLGLRVRWGATAANDLDHFIEMIERLD